MDPVFAPVDLARPQSLHRAQAEMPSVQSADALLFQGQNGLKSGAPRKWRDWQRRQCACRRNEDISLRNELRKYARLSLRLMSGRSASPGATSISVASATGWAVGQ